MGSMIGAIKGHTRSSDYSSHRTADAKEAHIQIVVPKVHSIAVRSWTACHTHSLPVPFPHVQPSPVGEKHVNPKPNN